ncbi:MAG TPA: hypothetical protein VGJ13_09330 [Pseudonocardiaceae bacterium]
MGQSGEGCDVPHGPLGEGAGCAAEDLLEPLASMFGWIRDHATDILTVQAEFDQGDGR